MINHLAHAGENHEETVEAAQHIFEVNPWLATPAAIILMILLGFIVQKLFKSSTITYVVVLAELLLVGMLTYSVMPTLSIISIIFGFLLSLATVLFGLGGDK